MMVKLTEARLNLVKRRNKGKAIARIIFFIHAKYFVPARASSFAIRANAMPARSPLKMTMSERTNGRKVIMIHQSFLSFFYAFPRREIGFQARGLRLSPPVFRKQTERPATGCWHRCAP